MRVTFVAMGWENISIEYLSSFLKAHGHKTALAYDQALFDDKNYVCIPWLYNLLDRKENCLRQILDSRPELVAFSVMSVTFQWALGMAELVKRYMDVPIIFGGAHPSAVPDVVIRKGPVDMVCIGEGEHALLELCDSLERNEKNYSIQNIWFKLKGDIIANPRREQIKDLDSLPFLDKDLFSWHVPIKNYYVAVISRGCPFRCSYCNVSFEAKEYQKIKGRSVRERSVANVIEELKVMLNKFSYKWIDFRNSVFSTSEKWTIDFCEIYKKEINLPFRIFSHPRLIWSDRVAVALRDAGCFAVQIGLESFDDKLRKEVLNRNVSNEEIIRAVGILERNRLSYSLDYILGIPGQAEEECVKAADFFSNLRHCHRISPFMCQYLPGLDLVQHGKNLEGLSSEDVEQINNGLHDNYMAGGSVTKGKRKIFMVYKIFFRAMSFMPVWLKKLSVKYKLYRILSLSPNFFAFFIKIFDIFILIRDRDARTYFYNYCWWLSMRFKRGHPFSWFYGKKYRKEVREHFRKRAQIITTC